MYFDVFSSGTFKFECVHLVPNRRISFSATMIMTKDGKDEELRKETREGMEDKTKESREEAREETMVMKMKNDNEYNDKMTIMTTIKK